MQKIIQQSLTKQLPNNMKGAKIDPIISKIVKDKIPCYFVSPHFDDAILSAGDLMSYLSTKTNVTIINVFTKAGSQNTNSAKKFLNSAGYKNSQVFFADRNREDKKIFEKIKVKRINLDFTDALWRTKRGNFLTNFLMKFIPEVKGLYPIYFTHVVRGDIAKEDEKLILELARKIDEIAKEKDAILFCPAGVGNHVDHRVVKEACLQTQKNLIYWQDFPYSVRSRSKTAPVNNGRERFEFIFNPEKKEELIRMYKTQVSALFPGGIIPTVFEVFFPQKKSGYKIYEEKLSDSLLSKWQKVWENGVNPTIFNSPSWFAASNKTYGYKNSKIFVVEKNGKTCAIWPLVEVKKMGISVLVSPGEEYLDKTTLLITNDDKGLLNSLVSFINKNHNLLIQELSYSLSKHISAPYLFARQSSVSPYLPITGDLFSYSVNRQINKIQKILASEKGKLEHRCFYGLSKNLMKDISEVDAKSIKIKKGWKTLTTSKGIEFFMNLSKINERNMLTGLLYYKEKPIAYMIGLLYKKVHLESPIAYDENFRPLIPGKVLVYLTLKKLQKEGFELFDFSRGESQAKYDFTRFRSAQYDVFIAKDAKTLAIWKLQDNIINFLKENEIIYKIITKTRYLIGKVI